MKKNVNVLYDNKDTLLTKQNNRFKTIFNRRNMSHSKSFSTEQLKKRIEQELELCELRKIDILSAEIVDRIFRPRIDR